MRGQYQMRRNHYSIHFPGSSPEVVCINDQSAGAVWVYRSDNDLRIVDIAMLPEYRNQGIGSAILRGLCREGDAKGKPIRLTVFRENTAAFRLYTRLGFQIENESATDLFLKRSPGT